MFDLVSRALSEIEAAWRGTDAAAVDDLADAIVKARRIMVYGCGREGLMMRAIAMRLAHLGFSVAVQGDMAAPPLAGGDLFLAACGPGDLATVHALAEVAKAAGTDVRMITAEPGGRTVALADALVVIPARTMARADAGALPMGSVFEAALFLIGEQLVQALMIRTGQTFDDLALRHTNIK